jgi:dsDNA-binding SOS-regulon protein
VKALVAGSVIGTIGATASGLLVWTIPSNLATDVTLAMLTALLTSGTVLLPLAGVVVTFVLSSANARLESLRRERLEVWKAQQEAHVKAIIENKPDNETAVVHQFQVAIDQYDAKIALFEKEFRPLGLICVIMFVLVLLQILLTLRTMAEVSPQLAFPYRWVHFSVFLLLMALLCVSLMVYETTEVGHSAE